MFSPDHEAKVGSMLDKRRSASCFFFSFRLLFLIMLFASLFSRKSLRPQPISRILVEFINIHDNARGAKVLETTFVVVFLG